VPKVLRSSSSSNHEQEQRTRAGRKIVKKFLIAKPDYKRNSSAK
jgi:hypothetical protein